MSDLIVIGYPDEPAPRVWDEVRKLENDYLIDLEDAAVIIHKADGKFEIRTAHNPVAGQTFWGLFWGFLVGLIFLVPLFGIAVGAATGAIFRAIEQPASPGTSVIGCETWSRPGPRRSS